MQLAYIPRPSPTAIVCWECLEWTDDWVQKKYDHGPNGVFTWAVCRDQAVCRARRPSDRIPPEEQHESPTA